MANEEDPKILFLSETHLNMDGFHKLKRKLEVTDGFTVPRIGLGGGLALLWCNGVDVDIQTSSSYHIDTLIKQECVVWRLTGFYGHLETSRRGESWDLLRQLHASFSLP